VKTLVLIRHGKSSWAYPNLADRDRPLKKRGINDGMLILSQLKQYAWENALALSSPANRAYSTAKIICDGLDLQPQKDNRLYFEGEEAILEAIAEQDNESSTIFCFGHQPITASLYARLSGNDLDHIPTTGVAIIDFETESWAELSNTKGNTRALLFPKMFK